jgi:hypothetical protein
MAGRGGHIVTVRDQAPAELFNDDLMVASDVWIMLKSVGGLTKPQFFEILKPGKLGSYIFCSNGADGQQT